jgi:hypothetical protein
VETDCKITNCFCKQDGRLRSEAHGSLVEEMFPRGIPVPLKCFKRGFYFQQIKINVYKRWRMLLKLGMMEDSKGEKNVLILSQTARQGSTFSSSKETQR